MIWLGLLFKRVGLKLVALVVVVGMVLTALAGAQRAGAAKERLKTAKRNLEVKDAQARAAMRRPRSRGDLDKRLSDRSF